MNSAYDSTNQPLTFETDKFSDYAVVYNDVSNPRTGETQNPTLWIFFIGIAFTAAAACCVIASGKRKHGKREA